MNCLLDDKTFKSCMKYLEDVDLPEKQKLFCIEYLKDFNGTQAAIRSGYSKKTAKSQANRLLTNVDLLACVREMQNRIQAESIMDVVEIQVRLSKIARGEVNDEVVVVTSLGEGITVAGIKEKRVDTKEQTKALELLGKANGLFIDKIQNLAPPTIVDDVPDDRIEKEENNEEYTSS